VFSKALFKQKIQQQTLPHLCAVVLVIVVVVVQVILPGRRHQLGSCLQLPKKVLNPWSCHPLLLQGMVVLLNPQKTRETAEVNTASGIIAF
jgi:hypothetical protein